MGDYQWNIASNIVIHMKLIRWFARFSATFQAIINGLSECLCFDSLIKLSLTTGIGHEKKLHLATKSHLKKAKSSQNNGIRWSNTYDALTLIEIISIFDEHQRCMWNVVCLPARQRCSFQRSIDAEQKNV